MTIAQFAVAVLKLIDTQPELAKFSNALPLDSVVGVMAVRGFNRFCDTADINEALSDQLEQAFVETFAVWCFG